MSRIRRVLPSLILFVCLSLSALILSLPAEAPAHAQGSPPQDTATPVPTETPAPTATPAPRPRNPTETLTCGFPVHGIYNASAGRTWTLTSDCTLPLHTSQRWQAWLHFDGGDVSNNCPSYRTFTINGGGHTVTGYTDQRIMFSEGCVKVVMKNITFVLDTMPGYHYPSYRYESHFSIRSLSQFEASTMTVTSSTGGEIFYIAAGTAKFTNLAMRNNHTASPGEWSQQLVYIDSRSFNNDPNNANAKATFANLAICDNTGNRRLFFVNADATIELKGAFLWDNNTWQDSNDGHAIVRALCQRRQLHLRKQQQGRLLLSKSGESIHPLQPALLSTRIRSAGELRHAPGLYRLHRAR